jgi:hypothetical protein
MKYIIQFNNWFNTKFGWFFTNGNKYNAYLTTTKEEPKPKYILERLNDGLIKTGSRVQYIEWDENTSEDNSLHDDIKVNRSLILNPGTNFTWLTTAITEIVEQRPGYIKFQTKNSTYELIVIENMRWYVCGRTDEDRYGK